VGFVLFGEGHRGLFLLIWAGLGVAALVGFRASIALAAQAGAKALQGMRLRTAGWSPGLRRNGVR
jgi:hypothetical protein